MRTVDTQKEEQTKAEILNAAKTLFQKYGLDKTSMEDIASATGKGKSTLYYYFKSKDEVFFAVVQKEIQEVEEKVRQAVSCQKTNSAKLRTMLASRYYETKSKMLLYPIFIQETKKHFELFKDIQCAVNETAICQLKEILLNGIRAGEFKSISAKDCDSLAIVAMSMWMGMDANIILSGKMPSNEIRVETTIDVFVRGIR
ncbi:MAG: TetR/AcrR family transcriptional regulator [Elusimicrobiaceae bacterium]